MDGDTEPRENPRNEGGSPPVGPIPDFRKQMPYSLEAEQSLLGGLMLDEHAWNRVGPDLRASDFHLPQHRIIYEAMSELAAVNKPFDIVTLSSHLSAKSLLARIGGNGYLTELVDATLGTRNLETYAEIAVDRARRRQLIRLAGQIRLWAALGGTKTIDDVETLFAQSLTELTELASERGPRRAQSFGIVLAEAVNDVRSWTDRPPGLKTGFADLDAKVSIRPGNLAVIAARPSMGKTALMFNIAVNVAREGQPVLVYSLEQTAKELAIREAARRTGIALHRLLSGDVAEDEWPKLAGVVSDTDGLPLFIDDGGGLTPAKIRARTQAFAAEHGKPAAVFVDYLGLMLPDAKGETRNIDVGDMTRALKAVAKEMDVPVVLVSQLNRGVEGRNDKRPMLSDLRDSGSIEQDADTVLFVYRDDYYDRDSADKGLAEIIVAKQRNGPTGTVKLAFDGSTTRFAGLAHSAEPDYMRD